MTEENPVEPVTGGQPYLTATTKDVATKEHPLTPPSGSLLADDETRNNGPRHSEPTIVETTELVTTVNVNVVTAAAILSPTGLSFRRDIEFEEWQAVGVQLRQIESGVQWWIGDWLRYGEHRYGETYAQAVAQTDLSYQTLANTVWVAGKVEFSRRRENLSFRHHAQVASLEPDEQETLLGEAETRKWTSLELGTAVQTYKREQKIAGSISGIEMTDCDLMNDDALTIDEWPMADLIIVVPPIHHNYRQNISVVHQWATRALTALRTDGNLFVIGESDQILRVSAVLSEQGLGEQTTIVWEKIEDLGFQRGYSEIHELILWGGSVRYGGGELDRSVRSIWKHPPTYEYDYPNDKPQEIIEQLIDLVTLPGEMIVDPFAGCGTVAAAAKKMRRNYWGCEPDKEGYEIARRRTGGPIR